MSENGKLKQGSCAIGVCPCPISPSSAMFRFSASSGSRIGRFVTASVPSGSPAGAGRSVRRSSCGAGRGIVDVVVIIAPKGIIALRPVHLRPQRSDRAELSFALRAVAHLEVVVVLRTRLLFIDKEPAMLEVRVPLDHSFAR